MTDWFFGPIQFAKRHSNSVVWNNTTDAHEWLAPADDIWSTFGLQEKIQTLDFYRLNWPSLPVERVWRVLKDNFPWAFHFSRWMWILHMIFFWQKMILLCWTRQHSTVSLHRTLALEAWSQSQVKLEVMVPMPRKTWGLIVSKPQSKFWIEFCQIFNNIDDPK